MMDRVQLNHLDDADLRSLLEKDEGVCVSILLPVQQETDKRVENQIRLKNLLRAAQEELDLLDFRRPDIEYLLTPAEDIIKGGHYLATESPGLAIYLAMDFSKVYQLPFALEEMVFVGSQYLIKPLMLLRSNKYYYVLALSQNEVRLLCATQYTVERMDLSNMPQSLAEALRWDDPERELQWHSQTGVEGDGRAAIFHGHGVGTNEIHKENLLRYFQLLDRGLKKYLSNKNVRLVLAGVRYLLPIYREASSYDYIFEDEISGSQEHMSDAELHQRSWKLVRTFFQQKRKAAESLYYQQANRALASDDLTKIIPAAHQGRVDTLFAAVDEQRWGSYDPDTGQLDLHGQFKPGDTDLLNQATIYTFLNDGDVYVDKLEQLPELKSLAAIFRF